MPDLETPGASASVCATPRKRALRNLRSPRPLSVGSGRRPRGCRPRRRGRSRSATALRDGARWGSSGTAITAGIVATITIHATRSSTFRIALARTRPTTRVRARTMSRQKYATTATSVPRCSATSNVWLKRVLLEVCPFEQPGHENEVPGRRDGQELREALDGAQDERLPVREGVCAVADAEDAKQDGHAEGDAGRDDNADALHCARILRVGEEGGGARCRAPGSSSNLT